VVDASPVNLTSFALMRRETGDNATFIADLVDTYLTNAPRLAAGMHEAVGDGRTDDLAHLAHELKSSSALLGVDGVASLCGEIEGAARRGRLEGVSDCLTQVDSQAPHVEAALRGLVDR